MKRLIQLVFFVALVSSCNSDNSTVLRDPMFKEHATQRAQILKTEDQNSADIDVAFLGDSHFEFMDLSVFDFESINLGVRGDTVYAISLRAKEYQSLKAASVIALSLGTNNVANGVPADVTVRQVKELVEAFPNTPFVIALLNPLAEESGFRKFNQQLFRINELLVKRLGQHERVTLVESMAPTSKRDFRLSRDHYGSDGIHFSEYGYQRWTSLWLDAFDAVSIR